MVTLSVIIINHNTAHLLRDCLDSLYETTKGMELEVWVVDNGSQDNSTHYVRQNFPQVKLIENWLNQGFAAGCNAALRRITTPYVLILNSDIILKEGTVALLLEFLEQRPEVGLVSGQLFYPDGSKQNSIANYPTLLSELTNRSLLRILWPHRYPSKYRHYEAPLEVESVIGACMMIRLQALQEVGLFDEDYFFFLEETDLCYRLRKAGWKIYHLPAAQLIHLQGQTARRRPYQARIEYYRSRYLFFRKNYGPLSWFLLLLGTAFRLTLNVLLFLLLNLVTLFLLSPWRRKLRQYGYLLRWHLSLCPANKGLRPYALKGPWVIVPSNHLRWFIPKRLIPEITPHTHRVVEELIQGGVGDLIQERPIRRIIRGTLPLAQDTIPVYLKVYRLVDRADRWTHFFRVSKARREAEMALLLREKGLPTAEPLILGERYRRGMLQESYLISREIEGGQPLDKFFLAQGGRPDPSLERDLSLKLARLTSRLHEAGIYHRDYHPGNLLLAQGKIFLIDLHHVKTQRAKLPIRRRINNLVQLNIFFQGRLRKAARARFFKEYCTRSGISTGERKIYARRIEERTRKACIHLYRRRQQRCLRDNRDYMVYKRGTYRGYLRRDAGLEQELPRLLEGLSTGSSIVKEDKKTTLFLMTLSGTTPHLGEKKIYIKQYHCRGISGLLKGLITFQSRPLRAWKMAHAIIVRHFDTALPLAMLENRPAGIFRGGFFLSQEIPDALGIDWFVLREFGSGQETDRVKEKREFIRSFARHLNRWHQLNLFQRDLKASNILVTRDGGGYRFYFIDPEGLRLIRRLRPSQRLKNLAQLHTSFSHVRCISQSDKLRFLKHYLGAGASPSLLRYYWRQVARLSEQRLSPP